jgi:hypothetical protein
MRFLEYVFVSNQQKFKWVTNSLKKFPEIICMKEYKMEILFLISKRYLGKCLNFLKWKKHFGV